MTSCSYDLSNVAGGGHTREQWKFYEEAHKLFNFSQAPHYVYFIRINLLPIQLLTDRTSQYLLENITLREQPVSK